tara:strand:+ start:1090 stop:1380 length:291 start_codon:yes stop_codon:yes gene_type:complete
MQTLPKITENGQLSRRFTNLEAAILIWKKREVRMNERKNSGETIDSLSHNMYVDTQWKVLDKIYDMWPECGFGTQGSNLLNDTADMLFELNKTLTK